MLSALELARRIEAGTLRPRAVVELDTLFSAQWDNGMIPHIVFAGGTEELDWTLSVMFDAMGAMSSDYNDTPDRASRAYDLTHEAGVPLVTSAGNDGADMGDPSRDSSSPNYGGDPRNRTIDPKTCERLPLAGEHVISVASVDEGNVRSTFSNWTSTPDDGLVDVAAPTSWLRCTFLVRPERIEVHAQVQTKHAEAVVSTDTFGWRVLQTLADEVTVHHDPGQDGAGEAEGGGEKEGASARKGHCSGLPEEFGRD